MRAGGEARRTRGGTERGAVVRETQGARFPFTVNRTRTGVDKPGIV